MNKLPVQEELINLGRREQKQERYLAIYPLGTIPCLKASTCERAIFRNSGPGPSQLGQEAHRQQRFNELSHMLGGRLGAAGKRLHFALFGTKAQGQPASSLVSRQVAALSAGRSSLNTIHVSGIVPQDNYMEFAHALCSKVLSR